MKTTDKIIAKIALPVIGLAAGLLIFTFVASSKSTTEQNNAYIRVINCIVYYKPSTRTEADIEHCYKLVEGQTHVKLQRYDSSTK